MSKQITVGFDGSEPSREAVMWAAAEASARRIHLRIVRCYLIPVSTDAMFAWRPSEALEAVRMATEAGLDEIKTSILGMYPDLDVTTEAFAGSVLATLIDSLDEDDLVVVGASGHHGTAAFWLGSTPRYLVGHSPCPVVVVHSCATKGRPDRIVVAVGGQNESHRALLWAGDEADRHQVPLVVVHTWWYPYGLDDLESSQARDLTEIDAGCALDRAVERVRDEFACDVSGQLVYDRTADGLLGFVRDGDLLVLGSRGRGPLRASVAGSTVNSVLEASVVPVVVVRDAISEH